VKEKRRMKGNTGNRVCYGKRVGKNQNEKRGKDGKEM